MWYTAILFDSKIQLFYVIFEITSLIPIFSHKQFLDFGQIGLILCRVKIKQIMNK
jgi:hypothetical protein